LWNGQDLYGRDVASGTYIVRVKAGDKTFKRRIVLLRYFPLIPNYAWEYREIDSASAENSSPFGAVLDKIDTTFSMEVVDGQTTIDGNPARIILEYSSLNPFSKTSPLPDPDSSLYEKRGQEVWVQSPSDTLLGVNPFPSSIKIADFSVGPGQTYEVLDIDTTIIDPTSGLNLGARGNVGILPSKK